MIDCDLSWVYFWPTLYTNYNVSQKLAHITFFLEIFTRDDCEPA